MPRGVGRFGPSGRPRMPVYDRYIAKVDMRGPDECWPWKGHTNRKGHGEITLEPEPGKRCGKRRRAHVFGWEHVNGPMPADLQGNHRCNNGWCQNPAHVYAGTQHDNIQDQVAAGTHVKAGSSTWGNRGKFGEER